MVVQLFNESLTMVSRFLLGFTAFRGRFDGCLRALLAVLRAVQADRRARARARVKRLLGFTVVLGVKTGALNERAGLERFHVPFWV